jgi:lycopene cyclase domain-containing protein
MSYFQFLALYICIPIIVLLLINWWDRRSGRLLPEGLRTWSPAVVIAAHSLVALIYTTPWDNYLVATHVWWYDPKLVTGVVIGWVPIEEYTFFVLQPILTGLWLLVVARRLPAPTETIHSPAARRFRWIGLAVVVVLWAVMVGILVAGWQPGTYMALLWSWALFPVMIQFAFGGDILWRYRWLVLATLLPTTLYLSLVDALAIDAGTWTINPLQSTGILLGNLPIEEAMFFLATNALIALGITLVLARESQERAPQSLKDLLARLHGGSAVNGHPTDAT